METVMDRSRLGPAPSPWAACWVYQPQDFQDLAMRADPLGAQVSPSPGMDRHCFHLVAIGASPLAKCRGWG